MLLSLTDAARMLGRSERQVRYLIQEGRLTARKDGARWVIDSADLPLSEGQRRAAERKSEAMVEAVQDAITPHLDPERRLRRSATDLYTYRTLLALAGRARTLLGDAHPATTALVAALEAAARGSHSFHHRDKQHCWREARDRTCAAIARMHLQGTDEAAAIAGALEQEFLPGISGLLKRVERRMEEP